MSRAPTKAMKMKKSTVAKKGRKTTSKKTKTSKTPSKSNTKKVKNPAIYVVWHQFKKDISITNPMIREMLADDEIKAPIGHYSTVEAANHAMIKAMDQWSDNPEYNAIQTAARAIRLGKNIDLKKMICTPKVEIMSHGGAKVTFGEDGNMWEGDLMKLWVVKKKKSDMRDADLYGGFDDEELVLNAEPLPIV